MSLPSKVFENLIPALTFPRSMEFQFSNNCKRVVFSAVLRILSTGEVVTLYFWRKSTIPSKDQYFSAGLKTYFMKKRNRSNHYLWHNVDPSRWMIFQLSLWGSELFQAFHQEFQYNVFHALKSLWLSIKVTAQPVCIQFWTKLWSNLDLSLYLSTKF